MSHREAAAFLNVHLNTVGPWFQALEERGFIRQVQGPWLEPSGVGKSALWLLEEEATQDGKPAGKAFMRWVPKQNPRTENRTPRHKKQGTKERKQPLFGKPVLKIVPG